MFGEALATGRAKSKIVPFLSSNNHRFVEVQNIFCLTLFVEDAVDINCSLQKHIRCFF